MSCGELLETLQVVGQPVEQSVLVTYGEVFCHGGDDVDTHGE
jgi:hypothetical protein